MRRALLLTLLVLALVAMAAAPGVAKPGAVKDTYYLAECFDPPAMVTAPHFAGPTMHVRGWQGTGHYVISDEVNGWASDVWEGINHTIINFNAKAPAGPTDPPGEPFRLWGTFDIELDGIGHFTGTWSNGRGVGTEVDGKRLMKVDLDVPLEGFVDEETFPFPMWCTPTIVTIIDPGN